MKIILKTANNIKIISSVLLLLLFCSCNDKNYDTLKGDNDKLKNENKKLQDKIDSLTNAYAHSAEAFEENLKNELKINPDSTIAKYKTLIQKYPDSYWQRESEKRIKFIESKRIFWSQEKGWDLYDIPKKPNFNEKAIYCRS